MNGFMDFLGYAADIASAFFTGVRRVNRLPLVTQPFFSVQIPAPSSRIDTYRLMHWFGDLGPSVLVGYVIWNIDKLIETSPTLLVVGYTCLIVSGCSRAIAMDMQRVSIAQLNITLLNRIFRVSAGAGLAFNTYMLCRCLGLIKSGVLFLEVGVVLLIAGFTAGRALALCRVGRHGRRTGRDFRLFDTLALATAMLPLNEFSQPETLSKFVVCVAVEHGNVDAHVMKCIPGADTDTDTD